MKKNYFILMLLCNTVLFAQNPTFQWAKGGIGSTGDDASYSVATDAMGNVYTTGKFIGTVDFDPGAGVANLSSNGSTKSDVFIMKSDSNGNLAWVKSIGGADNDQGNAIKTDANGNVFVVGTFAYVCDFDPGAGVHNLGTTYLRNQCFILKLDPNGNFLWADRVESTNPTPQFTTTSTLNYGRSLAIDASGNVFVAGIFMDSTIFGGSVTLSGPLYDIFIMKYDNSGVFNWVKQIGGSSSETSAGIDTDASGNIYMTGYFLNSIDADPSAATSYLVASSAYNEVFLLKLDVSGNLVWAKKPTSGSGDKIARDIKVSGGDVYIAGNYNYTVDFDPTAATNNNTAVGDYDDFISKFDTSGNYYWTKSFGGTSADYIGSIATDSANNIYATGSFSTTVDFDPSPTADYTVPPFGANNDVYILKLTSAGNFNWVQQLGGSAGSETGNAISLDGSNNLVVTGTLAASGNYQPFGSTILATHGSNDVFMVKMQGGTLSADTFRQNAFQLFPNPNNGQFAINVMDDADVVITNTLGQVIFKQKIALGNTIINLQDKAKGIYFVTVNDDSKHTFKMIKQ